MADAAVIGVPDEQWGEVVKAVVVPAAGCAPTEQELIDFCRGQLAGYKRPRSVDFIAALPRNPSGKVLERELRAPYWKDRQRGVNEPAARAKTHPGFPRLGYAGDSPRPNRRAAAAPAPASGPAAPGTTRSLTRSTPRLATADTETTGSPVNTEVAA